MNISGKYRYIGLCGREVLAINDTKIKYLSVADKTYEVTSIDWQHLYLEARETDLNVGDVEESELWDISNFDNEFSIRLINNYGDSGSGMGEIIDFTELVSRHKGRLRG